MGTRKGNQLLLKCPCDIALVDVAVFIETKTICRVEKVLPWENEGFLVEIRMGLRCTGEYL